MTQETYQIYDHALLQREPLVTVLMLTFQHDRFLANAIESILNQKCNLPIELIIAEDCSPDKTLKIAKIYQEKYPETIRIITGTKNLGMHSNFARSIPLCRGRYISFCEGDDYWHDPQKISRQIELMYANPEIAMCHTDYNIRTRFGEKKNTQKSMGIKYKTKTSDGPIEFLNNWATATATTLYKTQVVREFITSKFHNCVWPFVDYSLALFASTKGTIGYIPQSTATYRKTSESATNSGFHSRLKMEIATLECMTLFINDGNIPIKTVQESLCKRIDSIHRMAFFCGDTETMEKCKQLKLHNDWPFNETTHTIRKLLIRPLPIYRVHRWRWGIDFVKKIANETPR